MAKHREPSRSKVEGAIVMSYEVEADINRALYDRIEGHEFSGIYPIAYPGVKVDIPSGVWLSVKNHFASTNQITFGDEGINRYIGFLRVDVNHPIGLGELPGLRIAGEIALLYKRGTEILHNNRWIRITQPPNVSEPLESSEWIRIPVTIRWQSDNPNVS